MVSVVGVCHSVCLPVHRDFRVTIPVHVQTCSLGDPHTWGPHHRGTPPEPAVKRAVGFQLKGLFVIIYQNRINHSESNRQHMNNLLTMSYIVCAPSCVKTNVCTGEIVTVIFL